jgi:ribulose 1,5-bisphosphate synthetase/thiazole synthase
MKKFILTIILNTLLLFVVLIIIFKLIRYIFLKRTIFQKNDNHDFDVIIVGGGSVGLFLGIKLLKQGRKVIILEKREKGNSN